MTLLDIKKRRSKKGNTVVTKVYKGRQRPPKTQHHHHHHQTRGCFPAGTLILTPLGQTAIEDLRLGDSVVSYKDGTKSIQPVLRIKRLPLRTIVLIHIRGRAKPIRTTRSHSFSTERGWITAIALQAGDQVHVVDTDNIRCAEINFVESTLESCDVYSLTTASTHTFVAEGMVAHNFTYLRTLRTFLYRHLLDAALIRNIARLEASRTNASTSSQAAHCASR